MEASRGNVDVAEPQSEAMGYCTGTYHHNTVMVDGTSQARLDKGEVRLREETPEVRVACSEAADACPGIGWRRTVIAAEQYTFILDHLTTNTIHQYDWLLRSEGEPKVVTGVSLPMQPPNDQLREGRAWRPVDGSFACTWKPGSQAGRRLSISCQGGATVFTGKCSGETDGDKTGLVVCRQMGCSVDFAALLAPMASDPHSTPAATLRARTDGSYVISNGKTVDVVRVVSGTLTWKRQEGDAVKARHAFTLKGEAPAPDPDDPHTPDGKTRGMAVDAGHALSARQFVAQTDGSWLSPMVQAEVAFDELIYWWKVKLPRDEAMRLYLQVEFPDGYQSPWLYAGFWGTVKLVEGRKEPAFDRGRLEQDQLLLKQKAKSFRFKVVSAGKSPLTVLPSMGVMVTDNTPSLQLQHKYQRPPQTDRPSDRVLDLPWRLQQDSDGNPLRNRCQSAALATAMQYLGTSVTLEWIICHTVDPEYIAFGIWPRTVATAMEFGFDAYIDRFRDWDHVRETLAENKVILCSIRMPKVGRYVAPPYRSMGGHIVALCGLTPDGRVIITDSSKSIRDRDGGYLCQWIREDAEKIWMREKGGVGMVICPPPGTKEKPVKNIAPFPYEQRKEVFTRAEED